MTTKRPIVLLIGDTLNFGGTEGQFVAVASGLDRSRWDVRVCCVRAEGGLDSRLRAAGLQAWSCGPGSFKSPRFLLAVWKLARHLRTNRIELAHTFGFHSNIVGVLAARLARVPAIASQRELGDLRPPVQLRIQQAVLRLAHRVLVNSPVLIERLRALSRVAPARIALVPNGVDVARFYPPQEAPRHRSGVVTVGTLANLRPEKGLEDLLRAFALVRQRRADVRLVIWGDGPLRRELETTTVGLGLVGEVSYRGGTVEPEAALRELDVFVLPSHSEACSNALLEAMATGLPVVATSVGGTVALVDDERTGFLVPPRDSAVLAEAIFRLIDDPHLAAQLGSGGRERVRAEFALDRMFLRIEALYDAALAEGGARLRGKDLKHTDMIGTSGPK